MALAALLSDRLPATRHRDFRALWGGSACSSISLWTLLLGNAYIVYKLSDSSFWVGVSTFASMSPYLLAPIGGTIADRVQRRTLVKVTRLGAFATTSVLFVLAATDVIEVWMVVAVALAQGVVRAVEIPSDQALLANVVPSEDLGNAVALTSMTQHGSRAVGPLLSAPLLGTVGVWGAYLLAAIFALVAFTSVRRVQTESRGDVVALRQVFANLGEGLSYVRHHGPVASVFVLVVAHCALTMSFDAMLPGFARHELHQASTGFTIMTMGVGIGALTGTFMLAMFPGGQRGRMLLATAIASGVSPMLMAASMNVPAAAFSAVLMGLSQAMFMAVTAVLLQQVIPDGIRGRVMSFYLMSAGGIMAFANLGFGTLADWTGAPALFFLPGLSFVAIVLATAFAPHLRRLYQTGRIPAEAGEAAIAASPAGGR
ncbi:MAG: MFS transporter [Dehalococcoidia bacterium]|nr:MFS transporter [Dehalococcoidia bacterium]